jgi:hypothetical protein
MITRSYRCGYSLIELFVYISILAVVLGLAFSALYRGRQNSLDLRRNADDIARTLDAGERWRADVRTAAAQPRIVENGNGLKITHPSDEVVYSFEHDIVWRKSGNGRTAMLRGVKSSRMMADARHHITSLRWELELASPQRVVRVRPLFTFESVAKANP